MKINEAQIKDALKSVSTLTNSAANRSTREDLFGAYMDQHYKEPALAERVGSSNYLATDVADVVEAVFCEAMEIFTSDDHLVEFAPVGRNDEKAAQQETAIIHHYFREMNESFVILSTWFKEGLIEQNAYVRCGWIEKERVLIEEYDDLTFEQFMLIYQKHEGSDFDYEVEKHEGLSYNEETQIPEPILGDDGEPEPINIRVRCVKIEKKYEIEPIPQNEFFISPRWGKITLDGCPACGHKARKTPEELAAMGFAKASIEKLTGLEETSADNARHDTKENDDDNAKSDVDEKRVEVCEAYVIAATDNGKSERLLKIWTNGDGSMVLAWENGKDAIEEVESVPFIAWTPYIVPHRHVGRAVAELAANTRKLKTVLWRALLDNLQKSNNPKPLIGEDGMSDNTAADLSSTDPTAAIRMKDISQFMDRKTPSVLGEILPVMNLADSELEKHAGASRYSQGLDPNALSKSQIGSEGVSKIMDAGMRRMQTIIRTFAEVGLRPLFIKMHADMRRGPVRDVAEKIRGEWVETNPLEWKDRTDVKVRVGTGKGDREKRIAALMFTLGEQKEALAMGDPTVTPQQIHETRKRILRAMGLMSSEPYFLDPESLKPEPEPAPDPNLEANMLLAQAENKKGDAAIIKAQSDAKDKEAERKHAIEKLHLEEKIADHAARVAADNVRLKEMELDMKAAELAHKIDQDDEENEHRTTPTPEPQNGDFVDG